MHPFIPLTIHHPFLYPSIIHQSSIPVLCSYPPSIHPFIHQSFLHHSSLDNSSVHPLSFLPYNNHSIHSSIHPSRHLFIHPSIHHPSLIHPSILSPSIILPLSLHPSSFHPSSIIHHPTSTISPSIHPSIHTYIHPSIIIILSTYSEVVKVQRRLLVIGWLDDDVKGGGA